MKGLDIVRRDWSDLAKDAGNYVLAQILSSQARESIVENIHDYLTSGRKVNAGDTIPYVICDDGSTLAATQRSYHPDEFCKSETLKIDVKYYLANQDCERFRVKCKGSDCGQETTLESTPFSENDICPKCKIQYSAGTVSNQLTVTMRRHIKEYYMCQFLSLSLTLLCFVFQGWQKCDDPSCGYLTRQVPLTRHRGAATCPACCRAQLHAVVSVSKCCSSPIRHYSDTALYTQLLYFSRLFDWDIALKNSKNDKKFPFDEKRMKPFYTAVHSTVAKFLDANGYSEVSLTKLFSDFAF
ncbi:DNA polymerase alpha catalytic subunit [Acropora cervicornis]|uniref:DNA-directed DNA polymerase n=1 Tax=Acropora cervicornis TaxID=6130 RepID=A0AAD9R6C5_ACRCE|nr:DNA polymerase alpha catalytic subunit [Acropora cervicornis]